MNDSSFLCRSMLMTCALEPRVYDRALAAGADIGTIDLEDSVPAAAKERARRLALPYFAGAPAVGLTRALRINSLRTAEGLRDILALLDSGARPDALLCPKVESAQDLLILEHILGSRLAGVGFLAVIETAAGLCAAEQIAAATRRTRALVFGAADYAASLGTDREWENLAHARWRILVAAAAAGMPVIDAPCFHPGDEELLEIEIQRGRRMGFGGKAAVHPRQVAAINRGFSPQPAAIAHARHILDRVESSAGHICVVDGEMIGPPAAQTARRLLTMANRVGD
jgi:(S)-citramalyl-CoA lyase